MNLKDAIGLIQANISRMSSLYGEPMFDEWLIVDFRRDEGNVAHYSGSRGSEVQQAFSSDIEGLRGLLTEHDYQPGNFEFARLSGATRYDAVITIAPRVYLVCNHIGKSMFQIRQNTKWVTAIVPFLELADRFQRDPLRFEG